MKTENLYPRTLARKFFWMPKLPVVSGEVVIKALSKRGFIFRVSFLEKERVIT